MRVVLILICSLCSNLYLYSQSASNPPDVIPRSPEAGSLGRYGEIEVGEYTGTPNISIPLHTIVSGNIKYPLTLQYNANAVRVNQESTWVGLNWDLNAVAGIQYIPVGGNDQTDNLKQPWADWEKLIRFISVGMSGGPKVGAEEYPWITDCEYNAPAAFSTSTPPVVVRSALGPLGAVDLYAVNTPMFSFKFYLHRATGKPTVYGDKNNFTIDKVDNYGFVVTDGDGVKYYFLAKEITNELREETNWYLTEIRRPDGDVLQFTYENLGVTKVLPVLSEQRFYGGNIGIAQELGYVNKFIYPSSSIKNLYLTQIESLTEIVKFHLGTGREDLLGNGVRKLDSISVQDKFANYKKTFAFEYGYFQSPSDAEGYLESGNSGFTTNYLTKRLKLLSFIEKNAESGDKKYSFEYDEQKTLPCKTSYAVDHWGNYNGAANSTSVPTLYSILLFDINGQSLLKGENQFLGAKRGANKDYIACSMLKSIVYPTGGKTEFSFEPHSFKNYTIVSAADEKDPLTLVNIYDLNYPDGSGEKYARAEFELSTDREVAFDVNFNNKNGAFTYNQLTGTGMSLISMNPGNIGPVKSWKPSVFFDGQNYAETFSDKIVLPAGKYYVQINVTDNIGFQGYNTLAHASIQYASNQLSESVLNNYESIGAGVRIKEIKNFDINGRLISSKEYQYKNTDGTTSGKLLTPLSYTNYRQLKYVQAEGSCEFHYTDIALINSNSAEFLSTSPIRATVGYDRVTILDKDENDLAANGKIVKTFTNNTGLGFFFGSIVMADNMMGNGEVTSITYFDNVDKVVRIDSFEYTTENITRDWINAKSQKMYVGIIPCGGSGNGCGETGGYLIGVYPYLNFKRLLADKIQVDYTQGKVVRVKSSYKYNLTNYAVSEEKTTNSKNETIVRQLKYPVDISSGIYSQMIGMNIINPVVEETRLKNDVQQEKIKTSYEVVDNFYIKPRTIERQIEAGPTETVLTFGRYSQWGNIAQYQGVNGIYNSFIWGYNQTQPICRVENAKLSDVFYTGFEDDGNSVVGDCKTGIKSQIGQYTKQLLNLSNDNYLLTYWQKTGGNWTLQQKNVNVTAGSYTISFSSSDQVDDVRFYPAKARIYTFTYIPLIGMTSSTDPNGIVTYYEYDALGRLKLVRDTNKKVIKQNKYHYKN